MFNTPEFLLFFGEGKWESNPPWLFSVRQKWLKALTLLVKQSNLFVSHAMTLVLQTRRGTSPDIPRENLFYFFY
jgi:hypothetical protein